MKWKNIKISTKLIIVFLAIGITSILALGLIAYNQSRDALLHSAENELTAIRNIKRNQINDYFKERVSDLKVYANNSAVQSAANRFISAYDTSGLNSPAYKQWEDIHHSKLALYIQEYEYYDLFFISNDGDVAYTVAKESDLGKNVQNGELAGSPLAEAYKKGKDEYSLTDFSWYDISGEPAAFVSGPIEDDEGNRIGVLVYQLSLTAINGIMQERSGMGETGETYLVGSDKLMRSDSYLDQQSHSVEASFAGNVENNGVDTRAVREALARQTGTEFIIGYNGTSVLSSYAPVEFGDNTWALLAEIDEAEIMQPVNRLGNEIFIIAIVVGIIIITTSVIFARSIANPINKGVDFARKLANGDLTSSIDVDQKDEIGILADALKNMSAKLKEIVANIQNGADNIASASQQVSSSSQQLSQGASEQASSAEEVSSSMEEMTSNIQQNSDNAQETEKISLKAAERIKTGNEAAQTSANSMKDIAEKISIINDIAFQTNILALNAAVEAARAGEHGKGFAVVASEVRKLAERSGEAASEIDEKSKSGVEVAEDAGSKLENIVPEIEKTAKLVQEITAANTEMNSGADQVNSAVQQLNQVTQQNAASSEELATSAEELSSQADQLKSVVSFFKLNGNVKEGIDNIKSNQDKDYETRQIKTAADFTKQNEQKRKQEEAIKPKSQQDEGVDLKMYNHKSDESEYENY
ncbi:MAG: methyl-accepting chemotaxis protein [Bacteroidales bacterium]